MRGVCFVHVLFLHVAKRPNGRLAQVLGTPVKFPSDSRAIAIPWHRSSSSQKALWCRGALRVGGVRWAVEVSLGLSLKLLFCNPFSNLPKPDLLQLSLPQPGRQHLLHCALRLGSFGTSWITCTSLIPWATSCSPKTATRKHTRTGVRSLENCSFDFGLCWDLLTYVVLCVAQSDIILLCEGCFVMQKGTSRKN